MSNFASDDRLIGLAAQLQAAPGTYALLLGAGISMAAGIKTGWEILEDLCRKLAVARGVQTKDPTTWYKEQHGREANYSTVLEELAPDAAGRNALVRSYIDPHPVGSDEEAVAPTKAHRAIAQLVRRGLIRVILTLNFDDLLERALRDEGVTPVVITRAEDISVKPPYVHNHCTLIKLHGHYTDFSTLNTGSELGAYTPDMQKLLERVLGDFGLVTCGWSGRWDDALIDTIISAQSPYHLYFMGLHPPAGRAEELLKERHGTHISITSADSVFEELKSITEAISMQHAEPPKTLDLAVALTKRYLSEPKYRLAHRDMLLKEARNVLEAVSDQAKFPRGTPSSSSNDAELAQRWRQLADLTMPLAGMLAVTAAFGSDEYQEAVRDSLERLGGTLDLQREDGTTRLSASLVLPLVLGMYALGIAAMLAENGRGLSAGIAEPRFADGKSVIYDLNADSPFLDTANPSREHWRVISPGPALNWPSHSTEGVILELLRPALDFLGYAERRTQEAVVMLAYMRHLLVFRETARIVGQSGGFGSSLAETSRTRGQQAVASIPPHRPATDTLNWTEGLYRLVGEVWRDGDRHWSMADLWDGQSHVFRLAYDEWATYMRSAYATQFTRLPRWASTDPKPG